MNADTNECASCVGACCRAGTAISLSDDEKQFFEEGGAELIPTGIRTRAQVEEELRDILGDLMDMASAIVTDAPEHPEYLLLRDCPYLVQNELGGFVCSVYDDPRKPVVCDTFNAGGSRCGEMKQARQNQPLMPPARPS